MPLAIRGQGRYRGFLFLLLVFSLLMAFGTPIYRLFYAIVPGFEQVRTPWLVDGFTTGTALDPASDQRYAFECRKRTLPFGDDMELYALNASYASSNPIGDGATRRHCCYDQKADVPQSWCPAFG